MDKNPRIGLLLNQAFVGELGKRKYEGVDVVEIVTDPYFVKPRPSMVKQLDTILEKYPAVSHSMNLSVGSIKWQNKEYLNGLKQIIDKINANYFSDHFAYVNTERGYIGKLQPIPPLRSYVKALVNNITYIQKYCNRPVALENIVHEFPMKDPIREYEFLNEVILQSGCFLLFDITNLYVNSQNHNFDAKKMLKILPLNKVKEIHLAGYAKRDGHLIDSHDQPINPEIWDLFKIAIKISNPDVIILERDFNVPRLPELLKELKKMKDIVLKI